MPNVTKQIVDRDLRDAVFTGLLEGDEIFMKKLHKINDRQMGVILTDLNGHQRYVRIGAIVAEEREDMTAEELMESEIDAYEQKQADKAEKAKARADKAEKDKARRAAAEKAKADKESK